MARDTQKIVPLTSARFFAAFYVVFFHTFREAGGQPGRFLGLGYISVSFFFVLSGYILSVVYLKQREPVNTRRFLAARFARIYPLFVATLFLHAPLFAAHWIQEIGKHAALVKTGKILLGNLLMLHAWDVNLRGIDNPNWSLSVETFFYLMFPLFALLCARKSPATLRNIALVSYAVGLLLIAGAVSLHLPEDNIKYMPLLHLHEFIEGACVGLIAVNLQEAQQRKIKGIANYLLAACAVLFVAIVWFSPSISHFLLHDGLLSPLFLIVIIALAFGDGPLHRLLSHPWLELLGEASYALYLLHIPLWAIAKHIPHGHDLKAYPLFLLVAVGMSILSFHYLETPSRRYILKRLHSKPKETTLTSAIAQ